jgi:DNA modification methylase
MIEVNKIHLGDSYELIKQIPDKSVDLVIIDPPYGINADKGVGGYGSSPNSAKKYNDNWDNETPPKWFFDEILRIGKTVLIFGGQYLTNKLPQSNCWIVWDKIGEMKPNNPFSECELIWTNLYNKVVLKKYFVRQCGFINDGDDRFHPTQKPQRLLSMLIEDFSQPNDLILDCFSGSGTTCVAAKELDRRFIGIEIDPEYHKISVDRLNGITTSGQTSIFTDFEEAQNV